MTNSSDILHGKVLIAYDQVANVILLNRMLRTAGSTGAINTGHKHG